MTAAVVAGSPGSATSHDSGGGGEDADPAPPDLWLVFGDAGTSLHDRIYSPVGLQAREVVQEDEEGADDAERHQPGQEERAGAEAPGHGGGGGGTAAGGTAFQVMGPSAWWAAMRRHPRGSEFIRDLLRQVLQGLQVRADAGSGPLLTVL